MLWWQQLCNLLPPLALGSIDATGRVLPKKEADNGVKSDKVTPTNAHPLYAAWLRVFDAMIDAEEAWAEAKFVRSNDAESLQQVRDQARSAYDAVADRL